MIKLLVIDLDGTLLDNEKKIKNIDKKAVLEALKSGVIVSIFTGRNYHSAQKYLEELSLDVPVVFQNGALIMDFKNKKVLKKTPLSGRIAKKVIEMAREKKVFYIVYSDFLEEKDMYIDKDYEGPYKYYLENNIWRIVRVDDVLQHISDEVAEVALIWREEDILKITNGINDASIIKSTTLEDHSFYEIFGPGCSKAAALEFLEEHFGVNKNEVMFIGDGYNDLEIMRSVGLAVAMGNAPEDVKRHAHFVTKTNEEGGVAHAINQLLLKQVS